MARAAEKQKEEIAKELNTKTIIDFYQSSFLEDYSVKVTSRNPPGTFVTVYIYHK